ncbi:MAG: hypothetical protein JWN75_408 [Candidatus Saccharibacteria bacterium]|nr:hypothetical protein [Candidatus Saccharibacteria bacterium]
MATAVAVIDHPVPFTFPSCVTEMINDENFDFDLFEIEDYFGREVKNIDDAEVTFDDTGRMTGVTFHKMSAVDPKSGITLQFQRALKFFLRRCPFQDPHEKS